MIEAVGWEVAINILSACKIGSEINIVLATTGEKQSTSKILANSSSDSTYRPYVKKSAVLTADLRCHLVLPGLMPRQLGLTVCIDGPSRPAFEGSVATLITNRAGAPCLLLPLVLRS